MRSAIKIDENDHRTTCLYIDALNASSILQYVYREQVDIEFKEIRNLLKRNERNKEKYCKCDVSNKAINAFEMRFTRNGRNDRIYCIEQNRASKRNIILIELFEGKKSQDIPKKQKSRIETLGGYEYDI